MPPTTARTDGIRLRERQEQQAAEQQELTPERAAVQASSILANALQAGLVEIARAIRPGYDVMDQVATQQVAREHGLVNEAEADVEEERPVPPAGLLPFRSSFSRSQALRQQAERQTRNWGGGFVNMAGRLFKGRLRQNQPEPASSQVVEPTAPTERKTDRLDPAVAAGVPVSDLTRINAILRGAVLKRTAQGSLVLLVNARYVPLIERGFAELQVIRTEHNTAAVAVTGFSDMEHVLRLAHALGLIG